MFDPKEPEMRKLLWTLGALAPAMMQAAPAVAQDVALYRVVQSRDEVLIGVPGPAGGDALDAFARQLAEKGYQTVWQYAVARGDGGGQVHKPLRRVAVFAGQVARIEPYASEFPVLPPGR